MKTETVNLSDLHPPTHNVRVHPEAQVNELARSIKMFGQTRPIVVDSTGMVLVGNGLVSALKVLGLTTGIVLRLNGLSESDKRKIMLADNKIFELGIDHNENIMTLIREMDGDFDIPGFDNELLQRITAEVEEITTQNLSDYGRMNDNDFERTTDTDLPRGSTEPDAGNIKSDLTICPRCGFQFE